MGTIEQKCPTGPVTALDFALIDAADHLQEGSQHDRSPRIDAINLFVGNPVGSPYCAAGVSWCFHRAGCNDFPFSGLAASIRDWFENHGLLSRNPDDMLHWKGALFGWTLADGHGHIGFVAKRFESGGHVTEIGTVEFNTTPPEGSGQNGSERDGAYQKTRRVSPNSELWFARCDGLKGGAWWS